MSAQPIMQERQAVSIAIDAIAECPTNTRHRVNADEDAKLTESIRQSGVLQPVLVRRVGDGLELVFGHRRLRCARAAGQTEISAELREHMTDLEVLEAQVAENAAREDLHPLDEAESYQRLHSDHGRNVDDIAAQAGKSRSHVYQRMKLLDLVPAARKLLEDGILDASRALLVARIPDAKTQAQAAKEICEPRYRGAEPMSFRAAREHIEEHFMLVLAEAPWKVDDAALVRAAGACTTCPKRTGNQAELFADVQSGDICTDPPCFAKKKKVHGEQRLADAEAKGAVVLRGADAKKLWPHEYSRSVDTRSGLRELDAECSDDPKHRTYRQLLKSADIETVVAIQPKTGDVVELVPEKAIRPALKEAGHRFVNDSQSGSGGRRLQSPAVRAKEEIARKTLLATIGALVEQTPQLFASSTVWHVLAVAAIQGTWHDTIKAAVSRRQIERGKKEAVDEALLQWAASASEAECQGLVIELLVARFAYARFGPRRGVDTFRDACQLAGVDRDAIETRVRTEVTAAAAAKKAKAKPKKAPKAKASKAAPVAAKKKPKADAATPPAKKAPKRSRTAKRRDELAKLRGAKESAPQVRSACDAVDGE